MRFYSRFIIVILLFCLVIVACSNIDQNDERIGINEAVPKFPQLFPTKQLRDFEHDKKANQYEWQLLGSIDDTDLTFERLKEEDEVPKNKYIFNFKDSNDIRIGYNSDATCAVGLVYFDSIDWKEQNNQVDLFIRYKYFSYEAQFIINGRYKRIEIDTDHFKLVRIINLKDGL